MRRSRSFILWLLLVGVIGTALPAVPLALAQTNPQASAEDVDPNQESLKGEIDAIQDQVRAKEQNVKQFDEVIAQYRARIEKQTDTAETLKKQLELLDMHVLELEARVKRSQAEGERLLLEIQALGLKIADAEATLTLRRALLEQTLSQLAQSDESSPLVAMLAKGSMSAFVAHREEWRSLEGDLNRLTQEVRATKTALEADRATQQAAKVAQERELVSLREAETDLLEEREAKASLLAETRNREDEYRRIVADLRREQAFEADTLESLRTRLQNKLDSADEILARGDILLQWPVPVKRGISAHFHDRTYPFRNLFEHPGTDIPVPVGTPIKAAAGGYVAWNRTGRQYGNYVMIIHPNGIATVYAHLSAFAAKPDTYVERGEIIGYSGGRPGDPGAGLSTGPHLHFEVRQNGIPVNPELFLPEL